jgi:hypothetical protein
MAWFVLASVSGQPGWADMNCLSVLEGCSWEQSCGIWKKKLHLGLHWLNIGICWDLVLHIVGCHGLALISLILPPSTLFVSLEREVALIAHHNVLCHCVEGWEESILHFTSFNLVFIWASYAHFSASATFGIIQTSSWSQLSGVHLNHHNSLSSWSFAPWEVSLKSSLWAL